MWKEMLEITETSKLLLELRVVTFSVLEVVDDKEVIVCYLH